MARLKCEFVGRQVRPSMTGDRLPDQIQTLATGCTNPDAVDPTMGVPLQPGGQAYQVYFVKDLDARHVCSPYLFQNLVNRGLAEIPLRVRRIDHVQEQIGLGRLGQGGLKGLH